MRKALPWLLLAVSLAFNMAVAAGYVRTSLAQKAQAASDPAANGNGAAQPTSFAERMKAMADKLNLTPAQRKLYDEIAAEAESLRSSQGSHRDGFLAELVKDNPDDAVLKEYMVGAWRTAYREEMLRIMKKMMAILRPEQRQMYVETFRKSSSKR